MPATDVFDWLTLAMEKIETYKDKAWNRADYQQKFFENAAELVMNYYNLAITAPDFYENSITTIPNSKFKLDDFMVPKDDYNAQVAYKINQILFWKTRPNLINSVWKG